MTRDDVVLRPMDLNENAGAIGSVQRDATAMTIEESLRRCGLLAVHARNPELRAFGAWEQDRLVGFSYGSPLDRGWWWVTMMERALRETGRSVPLQDCFTVLELHVRPSHQRRGIGRELLERLCDGAPQRSVLLTTPTTATPAQALYRKLGFSAIGELSFGGSRSYVVMSAKTPLRGDDLRRAA